MFWILTILTILVIYLVGVSTQNIRIYDIIKTKFVLSKQNNLAPTFFIGLCHLVLVFTLLAIPFILFPLNSIILISIFYIYVLVILVLGLKQKYFLEIQSQKTHLLSYFISRINSKKLWYFMLLMLFLFFYYLLCYHANYADEKTFIREINTFIKSNSSLKFSWDNFNNLFQSLYYRYELFYEFIVFLAYPFLKLNLFVSITPLFFTIVDFIVIGLIIELFCFFCNRYVQFDITKVFFGILLLVVLWFILFLFNHVTKNTLTFSFYPILILAISFIYIIYIIWQKYYLFLLYFLPALAIVMISFRLSNSSIFFFVLPFFYFMVMAQSHDKYFLKKHIVITILYIILILFFSCVQILFASFQYKLIALLFATISLSGLICLVCFIISQCSVFFNKHLLKSKHVYHVLQLIIPATIVITTIIFLFFYSLPLRQDIWNLCVTNVKLCWQNFLIFGFYITLICLAIFFYIKSMKQSSLIDKSNNIINLSIFMFYECLIIIVYVLFNFIFTNNYHGSIFVTQNNIGFFRLTFSVFGRLFTFSPLLGLNEYVLFAAFGTLAFWLFVRIDTKKIFKKCADKLKPIVGVSVFSLFVFLCSSFTLNYWYYVYGEPYQVMHDEKLFYNEYVKNNANFKNEVIFGDFIFDHNFISMGPSNFRFFDDNVSMFNIAYNLSNDREYWEPRYENDDNYKMIIYIYSHGNDKRFNALVHPIIDNLDDNWLIKNLKKNNNSFLIMNNVGNYLINFARTYHLKIISSNSSFISISLIG